MRKRRKESGGNKRAIQIVHLFRVKALGIPVFVFVVGKEIGFLHRIEKRIGAGKCEEQSHKESKENNGPFSHSFCDPIWRDLAVNIKNSQALCQEKNAKMPKIAWIANFWTFKCATNYSRPP